MADLTTPQLRELRDAMARELADLDWRRTNIERTIIAIEALISIDQRPPGPGSPLARESEQV